MSSSPPFLPFPSSSLSPFFRPPFTLFCPGILVRFAQSRLARHRLLMTPTSLEMNRGSTLPVPNPVIRPVSLYSPPEHQRNNPAYLSPRPHRRSHRPQSSPLAGPSLSPDHVDSENKDDEENQKPRYRPNRISSTPDMAVPIQSLYDSDNTSPSSSCPPSIISGGTIGVAVPHPPIPNKGKDDAEDGNILRSLAKRLSFASTSSLTANEKDWDDQKTNKRHSSFISHSTSTTSLASTSSSRTAWTDRSGQAAPPIPTIPPWALNAMRQEAVVVNRDMRHRQRRKTTDDLTTSPSSLPLPNQPMPRKVHLSSSGLSDQPHSPSVSRDPKENWVTVMDPTPRFSRLGLGGDGVVMPIKKKEPSAKVKNTGAIRVTKSMVTISQWRESGVSRPGMGSSNDRNASNSWKRASLASSISVPSSVQSENMSPFPPSISNSGSTSTSDTNLYNFPSTPDDSALKTPKAFVSSPSTVDFPDPTRSTTLRRDSTLTATDDNQLPPSSPKDTSAEFGRRADDVKSRDTQKARMRRRSIKQIVMRITAAPMFSGEKLSVTTIHDSPSTPAVVLPPDTPMYLDPPPRTRFGKLASSSMPSLRSTKEMPEPVCGCGDMRGRKKFKSIRKGWKAVLATIRR